MRPNYIIAVLLCLTGIAATFLTWASQSLLGETTYLTGIDPAYSITKTGVGDGWLTLFCFCIITAITVFRKKTQAISTKKRWWMVLFALISLLISVYHILLIYSLAQPNADDALQMKVLPGTGLYVTILVSFVLMILPFTNRADGRNKAIRTDK